jgi:hypothetical protein
MEEAGGLVAMAKPQGSRACAIVHSYRPPLRADCTRAFTNAVRGDQPVGQRVGQLVIHCTSPGPAEFRTDFICGPRQY